MGYELQELEFPNEVKDDIDLSKVYTKEYEKGFKKRSEEEQKKHQDLGYESGYELVEQTSVEIDDRFIEFFNEGYIEGFETIKGETLELGYLLAFQLMSYEPPADVVHESLLEWYEEGYGSNDIAAEIKTTAYDNGYENKDYYIPEGFKVNEDAIALYDGLFYEGQEVKKEEDRERLLLFGGIGAGVLGVAGGGYYLRRRKN
ncbi:hypothetical protein AJ85_21620 [Alkalihalobacillus alcalophilus ATCC 27647 = CGMCC 1.3604]|uniref:Uncharacterized protein n=1 Tax=Alkalihalobacillus alcalophilus ATCC 27647 = CGMCC 1.3604 TaxID=1218173 RepID=A0A094WL10_ALKAL|nr:hypothetical protein [Alkalihalobacillus alcalophilus]KGA96628.1 hypothetical protein BALCAV_0215005 [Alkalihalobacillus alcalophilus ATCC 27647 = CGMCC 1.3604]MED1563616.1 hypothetical protein [Alkalihalobacillus alcalophilus]THG91988.1 hypothetical protein AJ85_21620 [Alkalihalobacillus alcalophilus ATCC 27647 = CGMCC 1.3604]